MIKEYNMKQRKDEKPFECFSYRDIALFLLGVFWGLLVFCIMFKYG